MYFANPWGLLGLLALPLIAFIHLYQRRFPRLEVGGLHLWINQDQVKTAGRRRDKLPITRTLLLELLIALLVTALLAKPQLNDSANTTHWVFVLDNSASMMGEDSQGTFRDKAIEEMEARVDDSGRNSKVSIILTGSRPSMLAGPAVSWDEAETTLQQWIPQNPRHPFQSGWDMAAQLAEGSGKTVFITDRVDEFAAMSSSMEMVSVGKSLPNAAFETTRWSIDSETLKSSLYMRIRNHSDQSLAGKVVGRVGTNTIFDKPIDLAARSSLPLSIELPGGIKQIDLALESNDDRLITDSQVQMIEPGLREVKVAMLLPGDHPGQQAFEKFLDSSPRTASSGKEDADLVVLPFAESVDSDELASDAWILQVGPLDLAEEARKGASSTIGPFLLDRRNPLLEGVSLQGAIWDGYQDASVSMAPLITVEQKILFGQRTDSIQPCYVLNIDLENSNLSDSPDFPILVSNLIEQCRQDLPGLRRWNYQLNEIVRMKVDPRQTQVDDPNPIRLVHDGTERSVVRSDNLELPPLTRAGIYELFDGDRSLGKFAVNFFDNKESDLSALKEGRIEPEKVEQSAYEATESARWIGMLLLALAIVAALMNWAGLNKSAREVTSA